MNLNQQITQWECKGCGAVGEIVMPADQDVYGGFVKVTEAHAETSPGCKAQPWRSIRVSLVEANKR